MPVNKASVSWRGRGGIFLLVGRVNVLVGPVSRECEGCLVLREMSQRPSYQTDLGAL